MEKKHIDRDTQKLLQQFIDNGAYSFESFSVQESREAYIKNSLNRLDSVNINTVFDYLIPTRDNCEIIIRVYDPRNPQDISHNSDPIIYIHGGGWVVGNLETHDAICRSVAYFTEQPVIAIDYRLAPEFPFPYALNDCLDALNYIAQKKSDLKISYKNVTLMGDSAGGTLATVIAHQLNESNLYNITKEILFYPVTSLAATTRSYQRYFSGYPLSAQTMYWFIDKYLPKDKSRDDPLLSPLYNEKINPNVKSFIVTVGLDPLCDEGVSYAKKLIVNGNFVEFHHLPNTLHGILTSAKTIKLGQEYLNKAISFIKDQ